MHSRATDRRSASKCQGKWPDQTLEQAFRLSEVLVAVSTSRLSCKRAGKTRTLMPVWDSSGESRFDAMFMKRRRGVSGGHFLRSEDDPHGSQEPRRHTHRTTLEGIPSASWDDSARACRRRPRNAGANQPL